MMFIRKNCQRNMSYFTTATSGVAMRPQRRNYVVSYPRAATAAANTSRRRHHVASLLSSSTTSFMKPVRETKANRDHHHDHRGGRLFFSTQQQSQQQQMSRRQRFYKEVDIIEISTPTIPAASWEQLTSSLLSTAATATTTNRDDEKDKEDETHNSPAASRKWYGIALDGKTIQTPSKHDAIVMGVPSKTLAVAVANEWNQQERYINPTQMPLTSIVCTVLDQTTVPNRMGFIDECLRYLSTDTCCYLADPTANDDRVLATKQLSSWERIWDACNDSFGYKPATVVGTDDSIRMAVQCGGLPHPPQLVEALQCWLLQLNAWELTSAYIIAKEGKSLLTAWYVMTTQNNSSVQHAIDASRIEEEYQIEQWGFVEGQHDYDRLNCSIQLTASVFVRDCLRIMS